MKYLYVSVLCLGMASLAAAEDLDRGIELYRKNDFTESASVLRKVVEQDPGNARASRYLGLALLEQGKVSEAEPYVVKANEMSPGGESNVAMARLAIEKKDYDRAADLLKDADGDETSYVRAMLEFNRKQYDESARDFESFLQSHPDFAYAHYWAGMAYNGMKRPDKMLTHFELFLRMKPDAPEARKVQSVLRAVR